MKVINLKNKDFKELELFLAARQKETEDISIAVKNIIEDVKNNGDAAVIKYAEKFDNYKFGSSKNIKVTREEIDRAYNEVNRFDSGLIDVIRKAAANIEEFHKRQAAGSFMYEREPGITLGTIRRPLTTAGIYVPAGSAPLPSSVLMNAIPAKVAGVKNIIMATPPGSDRKKRKTDNSRSAGQSADGQREIRRFDSSGVGIDPIILVAADIAGVTEIYKIGGAQAIAAMAYGTETVPKADIVTGPGNIYVAAAKKMIFGQCNIDMTAGPSEISIIADKSAKPSYIAADMLSQAEHDKLASSVLITYEESLIDEVGKEIEKQIRSLPRQDIAQSSLENYGAMILTSDINQAIGTANIIAPEHLELCTENAENYINQIENAGAVFIGNYSPEPLGDYFAGPNHVLPTSGTARFFSPLNVWNFIKQINVISYNKEALLKNAEDIIKFAQAEDLQGHAESIKVRLSSGTERT